MKGIKHYIVVVICLAVWSQGLGATAAVYPSGPGTSTLASSDLSNHHSWLVMQAIEEYFRLFGHWPHSWQDVRESGLVQVSFSGPKEEQIDPDDGKLDLPGDILYIPASSAEEVPHVSILPQLAGFPPNEQALQVPHTFAELYAQISPELRGNLPEPDDEAGWKLISIAALLRLSIEDFFTEHGRLPGTFQELISSGLTPIDLQSISPVTGKSFTGEGQVGDFQFSIETSTRPNSVSYMLLPVGADGKPILAVR